MHIKAQKGPRSLTQNISKTYTWKERSVRTTILVHNAAKQDKIRNFITCSCTMTKHDTVKVFFFFFWLGNKVDSSCDLAKNISTRDQKTLFIINQTFYFISMHMIRQINYNTDIKQNSPVNYIFYELTKIKGHYQWPVLKTRTS